MSVNSNRTWKEGSMRVSSREAARIINDDSSLTEAIKDKIVQETRDTVDMLRRRGIIKDDMPCW